ncbi:MAG TPA: adenylate/guanylate cyclase domain-containing protein [Solirubrobacteraceae bacterium]|nr:adenylate/guanylate cyclase domain-containing protein [Solirubrobacteraceae bacterium]
MNSVATISCASCGAQTPAGKKFCINCGLPVQSSCPACGELVIAGAKFCAECGAGLSGERRGQAPVSPASAPAGAVAERRLVSVLFADLVGFTTLSEHRDPEEVRELLSRYFDRCRTLIERYGGTVEKFIGDAVMAVWGTPVAREDDAERAVRTALAVTQAVTLLGEEVGMAELRVRAGVLTGQAAVELGAEGEGMVLGDTVNTASRLQSLAPPGTVLVDDVTRRASEAAVAYEDAGTHEVKGRERPVHAFRALRVVAGAGGARRGAGLEAPLVGRDRELALIVESFEATVAEDRARLVSVVGEAGAGKSRLVWEFFKYIDGIEKVVRWHQGRCLSYGEGVAYWALAEMVRARAGIVEEEDAASARRKLKSTIEEHVPEERERRLIEPRLAHLLGLEQRSAPDRADLFSGWRLFFERIAAHEPVVLVFEDLQWADSGLLDFIDYLLEWSAEFPLFLLALGRSELLSARPAWTPTITLEPLADQAMAELLGGLVPGLPEELATQIRRRSEGVPLYAVETVRMLLDRGLVSQDGARYVVTGDVAALEVPETLQALVASRLDNLDAPERALLQDAAVIGQSFTPATLAAVVKRQTAEVERALESLVSKQVLAFVDEALSAERGQYVFLQGLVRTIALSTLSRRDLKARHLAVARHLQETWGEEAGDIAEVLASHYLDAVEAEPDASDAEAIRASACQTLAEAGQRALSLALGPEARRHFERAAELAAEPAMQGRLLYEAGMAARMSGALDDSLTLLGGASELLAGADLRREAARVDAEAARVVHELGRVEEAWERIVRAYDAVDDGSDDEALADLGAMKANIAFSLGHVDEALTGADAALRIADGLRLGSVLVMALITKANALAEVGRPTESTALLTHATKLAAEQDLGDVAGRAYYNLAENVMGQGRFVEGEEMLSQAIELARRRGDRPDERRLVAQRLIALAALGRWDQVLSDATGLIEHADDIWSAQTVVTLPVVLAARGDIVELEALEERLGRAEGWSAVEGAEKVARVVIAREAAHGSGALADASEAVVQLLQGSTSEVPPLFAEVVECAFTAGEIDVVEELLAAVHGLKPAQLLPLLDAEAARARARLAEYRDDHDRADHHFRRAIALFRELETPFFLARSQLEYAQLLNHAGRDAKEAERLREEAAGEFESLGARPWLERADALRPAVAA